MVFHNTFSEQGLKFKNFELNSMENLSTISTCPHFVSKNGVRTRKKAVEKCGRVEKLFPQKLPEGGEKEYNQQ